MRIALLALALLAAACHYPRYALPDGREASAITGAPLWRIEPEGERKQHYEEQLARARQRWEAEQTQEDAIWVGRHLSYLGRYKEAIDWYTARLVDFPESARLRRHRGHRYISVRRFVEAVNDLEKAWELVEGTPDTVEPDGAPNALGIPRSTLQSNILYHLALAHYLRGEFLQAERIWRLEVKLATNDDTLVAALNWQVHSLRRMERDEEALLAMSVVRPEMDVIENHAYHRILLLQLGLLTPEEVLDPDGDGVQDATAGYGVGNWYWCNHERVIAKSMWREILRDTPWNAFGHIAAEADLAR